MATLDDYRGIKVLNPTPPSGQGGWAIDQNFTQMIQWAPKSNWAATGDPTTGDDSGDYFYPGSFWYNATSKRLFVCINNTLGAAVWHPILPNGSTGKVVADPDGNARGSGSVDLQTTRSAATQVASGTNATVSGGSGNTASGTTSAVGGGSGNAASNTNAFAVGESCTSSGNSSFSSGSNNVASASYSNAIGRYASATHNSEFARASGRFSATGDAQASYMIARNTTTNATQTDLFLNGVDQRMTIPQNCTWLFVANVVARRTGATVQSAAYQLIGAIRNNAGSTAILGTVTKTVIFEDAAAWDVTAVADDTNDALVIKVTGEASKTIQWVADTQVVQVIT